MAAFERKLETWSSTQQSTAPRLGECAQRPPVQTSASTMPPAVLSFEVCDGRLTFVVYLLLTPSMNDGESYHFDAISASSLIP